MKYLPGCGLIVLSFLATPALAAYKCVDSNGRVTYQAKPCPDDSHGGDMDLNTNRSFSGRSSTPVVDPYVLGIDFVPAPLFIKPTPPNKADQPDQADQEDQVDQADQPDQLDRSVPPIQ